MACTADGDVMTVQNGLKLVKPRGSNRPMKPLTIKIAPAYEAKLALLAEQSKENDENEMSTLKIGTPCKNACCEVVYNGPTDTKSNCVYHPGAAIFHEGMKFWSCCKKKTSDFSTFLDQKGCTTGEHHFSMIEQVKEVRQDWFNSGDYVHVNLYCKGVIPTESTFESNGFSLEAAVTYANGQKESAFDYDLFGEIDVENSHVLINERKIEIVLKQMDRTTWPKLRYDPEDENSETQDEVIVWNGLNQPTKERDGSRPMKSIKTKIIPAYEAKLALLAEQSKENDENEMSTLKIGTPCKNACCEVVYNGPTDTKSNCVYHPGAAIFHEGMKFWSCCNKKTSNFNTFLDQKGCTTGEHVFSTIEQVKEVREDWFNSGDCIHVNLYCKGAIPADSTFKSNGFSLGAVVTYANGQKESAFDYELFGEIDVENSYVMISERKVEMVLKQVEPVSWPKLRYEREANEQQEQEVSN
ncbi:hypothetical protein QR680_008383 [Steinernema hermaphroditum]|uniref:CS domain-containing protein n=1 Tax=Steinernema hermaphroditum TaxID=289476 RepID=A0AA39IGF7_9BILA|nr:hypothetical protein QR680_008383 [Steinernema hermaphroditum]